MLHALIVTDCDPIAPSLDRQLRLAQVQRLYRSAGAKLDIIFLGCRSFGPADDHVVHRVFNGFDRVGTLPDNARRDYLDQDNPRLFNLIGAMRPNGQAFDAVHLDQVLVRPSDDLADTWVLDTYDAAWEGPEEGRKFDALFAAFDGLRAHNADFAIHAMRMPLGLPERSVRKGEMIGWVGDFGNGLADRWSEVLDVLAQRGVQVRNGVLLAGPDAHWVRVPKVMAHLVIKSTNPKPGAERALGLAVLPADNAKSWLGRITLQIAAGCPVLTSPAIGEMYEDRWHLPTYQDANGFADAIEHWCSGENREALHAATSYCDAAFRYDGAAMDAYVRSAVPVFAGSQSPSIGPVRPITA